ncbi:MAG: hypothetical protein QM749_15830 [Aquabacterium sp.]
MSKPKSIDIDQLVDLPVQRAVDYLKFIAEHDLWAELHEHLKSHGCKHFKISSEVIYSIATVIQAKPTANGRIGCGSNSNGPKSAQPVLPTSPGAPDGGAPDGGAPDGGARKAK